MEVVYFFCEAAAVRVPLFNYDRPLFGLLIASGGTWDKAQREFTFGRIEDAGRFSLNFRGRICVWVDDVPSADSGGRCRIFGFLKAPEEIPINIAVHSGRQDEGEIGAGFGPEKFSAHWQVKLEDELRSRKYSFRTMRAYAYYNRLFCRVLQKTPEEIRQNDLTEFLAALEKTREYSASSMNLAISAIKFFYRNVLKDESIVEHKRPRHDKLIPFVPAKSEIAKILEYEKNAKHRLLLTLVYSSGLRVSEVVALRREHIDLERRVLYVRLGKGRKDRCTLLSERAARFLSDYIACHDIKTWLFTGQSGDTHLTIRAAQYIFDNALRRAEIPKKISIHSLRHAFATHLLESGIDIRYIQSLLGHANLRTTERYTHVARRNLLRIQSPFDTMP